MNKDKMYLLVRQAAKLTTLGITVERERGKLKNLIECGVAYSDPRMLDALRRFEKVDAEWKRLEDEHLALRLKLK